MSEARELLENYPDISFIDNMKLEQMKEDMISDFQKKYKEETGKTLALSPGDPNRIILCAAALQIYQGFQYVERAGRQSFLKYSYGSFLENLGALKGVKREPGKSAVTEIRFTVSELRESAITIPYGTRCTAGDNVYFFTTEDAEIPSNAEYIDIPAECTEKGTVGNGYRAGEINTLVDNIAYIGSVANTVSSDGGAAEETDESLAERIYLAPSSYSVAGPDSAYKYWAKTFNPEITDIMVDSLREGVVNIWFVMKNGEIPAQTVIDDLQKKLEQNEIRPLTDKVEVSAPESVSYDIVIRYWINESDKAKAAAIHENVNAAVEAYKLWQRQKIGRDINPSKLISFVMKAGVKRLDVQYPVFTEIADACIAVSENEDIVFAGVEND